MEFCINPDQTASFRTDWRANGLDPVVLQLALHRGTGSPSCPFLPPLCPFKATYWLLSTSDIKPYIWWKFHPNRTKVKKIINIYRKPLSGLIQQISDWWYFSFFSQKTAFDISCKLTICMKCQILFSGKKIVCHLMKILPRVDTEHITRHRVSSFLYDRAKCALSGTPLPWNPSWSTALFRLLL